MRAMIVERVRMGVETRMHNSERSDGAGRR